MKHLILLFLLFYLASCVEGEQKVTISGQGEGATAPSPLTITQKTASGSPQTLEFLPPNLAFIQPYCDITFCADNKYPFLEDTVATLTVNISNPSSLPFTLEWTVASNNQDPEVVRTDVNPTQTSSFFLKMGTAPFSSTGFYTIKSTLKDSTEKVISTNSWSIELVGADPTYGNFNPSPAPTPYVGSPFSVSNNITQFITATISNPSSSNYINNWYLDGVLQSFADQTGTAIATFPFTPSLMAPGNHVVVAQLTGNPDTTIIYNTATWSFEVTELPQFSTFTNPQLPSPAPFPDVVFGVGDPDIPLDPNTLYNPGLLNWTLVWELDGAMDSTATCNGGAVCTPTGNPDPFLIDPDNATQFGVGRHSVVALLYDDSSATPTIVDSASWNFEVVFPAPAVLTAVNPATTTQIFSVSTIPMNGTSPMGGFFAGPESTSSRGTPMVVALPNSSTNTFCINVSDGRGVGFGYAPTSAGVLVQYEYSDSTPINAFQLQFAQSASPPAVCLDGKGAINPADGVPNFSLNDTPTLNTHITAIVTDKLSLQEIGTVQWNITVTELNTQPTLLIAAPFSTTTVATVVQDATKTYSFTVLDQDCSPTLSKLNCYSSTFSLVSPNNPYPGITLNGTNNYYGVPTGTVTPDCERDYSYGGVNKFSCAIMIPSNDGLAPMPTTGTYQVNAQVNNLSIWANGSPTFGPPNYFEPNVDSDMLTWNLTVIESNPSGPYLINQLASGLATPTVDSYIYVPANDSAVATTATEGDPILFNLVVNDLQKDNYKIKFFHNTASASGTFTEYATPTYTYTIEDNPVNGSHPATMTILPFSLPFGLVTGAPSATITFRVQLTDVPDSASPLSNTFSFYINVFNVNPPPEVVTLTEAPSLAATGTVMQGFPYTMWADITDSSVGEGSGVEWQWMINQNSSDCASQTAASWKSITGADEGGTPLQASPPLNASLTWSPPALPATTTYCFRNCIGDDDFPGLNPATCTPAMAGPWVGPITGTTADIPDIASGSLPPDRGDTAVWADPVIDGDIYGLRVSGNKIFLFKYVYNLDTTVNQTNAVFTTRQGEPQYATLTEGAYDLSITGNNNFIFVSYVFNNPGILPPFVSVPTNMVLRISKLNFSSVDYFFNDRVPLGVGQIVANNSAFWVPYINSSLGDTPFFFAGDGVGPATTTINGSFSNGSFPISDSLAEIQSGQNGDLFIALKLPDGSVDLYQYNLPGSISSPTFKAYDPDIFYNYFVPFSDMSLAVGTGTNPNVFVAGIDTSTKSIFYGIKAIVDITNNNQPFVVPDISSATAVYPATFDPKGLNAVASTNPGEVLLGFVNASSTARSPFADLFILKSVGTNFKLSSRINRNRIDIPPPKKITSADFALTNVIPKFQIGSAGAVATENQKDTLWFRYWDYSTERMVIVNIENETFSSSTPTLGTEAWSDPWFKQ